MNQVRGIPTTLRLHSWSASRGAQVTAGEASQRHPHGRCARAPLALAPTPPQCYQQTAPRSANTSPGMEDCDRCRVTAKAKTVPGLPHACHREIVMPHMKTYLRFDPADPNRLAWFLLSSHNLSWARAWRIHPIRQRLLHSPLFRVWEEVAARSLSSSPLRHLAKGFEFSVVCSSAQAAWGELQDHGRNLRVTQYELGVLFTPRTAAAAAAAAAARPFACGPFGPSDEPPPGAGAAGAAGAAPPPGEISLVTTMAAGAAPAGGLVGSVLALPVPYPLPPTAYDFERDLPWSFDEERPGHVPSRMN